MAGVGCCRCSSTAAPRAWSWPGPPAKPRRSTTLNTTLLLRSAVEFIAGRIPVLAGTGLSNTAKTIEQTRRAAALGADAALVVTPPYVRPTQEGLIAHYRAVADDGDSRWCSTTCPAAPAATCCRIPSRRLAGHERIVGIKEARNDAERMAALLPLRDEGFSVLSGDDPTAARAMLAGADGLVSVASNVLPRAFRRLCDLARAGKRADADAWDARLHASCDFMGIESNPIPVKAVLSRMGIGRGLRLPLTMLSPAHAELAARIVADIHQIEQSCRDAIAA